MWQQTLRGAPNTFSVCHFIVPNRATFQGSISNNKTNLNLWIPNESILKHKLASRLESSTFNLFTSRCLEARIPKHTLVGAAVVVVAGALTGFWGIDFWVAVVVVVGAAVVVVVGTLAIFWGIDVWVAVVVVVGAAVVVVVGALTGFCGIDFC